jgi:hypothetical protein
VTFFQAHDTRLSIFKLFVSKFLLWFFPKAVHTKKRALRRLLCERHSKRQVMNASYGRSACGLVHTILVRGDSEYSVREKHKSRIMVADDAYKDVAQKIVTRECRD